MKSVLLLLYITWAKVSSSQLLAAPSNEIPTCLTTSIPTFSPLTDWSALTYDDFEERKENPTHSHQGIYSARIKGNNTGS